MPKYYELEIYHQNIVRKRFISLDEAKKEAKDLIRDGVKSITHINVVEKRNRIKTNLLTRTRGSTKTKKK